MTVQVSPITGGVITPLTDAATIVWAANQGYAYIVTLGGDRTLANPTNLIAGAIYTLSVVQDTTGSRLLTFGSLYKFPNAVGPTLTTTPGATDIMSFYSDGTGLTLLAIMHDVTQQMLAPSDLTASTDEVGQITLNWVNHATNATGVRIEIFGIGLPTWSLLTTVAADATSYVDIEDPGDYPYRVKSVRGTTQSAPSNTATGTSNP